MADIVATNVGKNAAAGELNPTHVQVLSAAFTADEIALLTDIAAGDVVANWTVAHAILVDAEIQVFAQDLNLPATYNNARSWAMWNGAPSQTGSKLLGLYVHDSPVAKIAGLRSSITLYWQITATQAAAANITNISAPPATTRQAGIGQRATQAQLDAGTANREVTSDLVWPLDRTKGSLPNDRGGLDGTLPIDRGGTGVNTPEALAELIAQGFPEIPEIPDIVPFIFNDGFQLKLFGNALDTTGIPQGGFLETATVGVPDIRVATRIDGGKIYLEENTSDNRAIGLPVLVVDNIVNPPAEDTVVYRGGIFKDFGLHRASDPATSRFSSGENIFFDANWNFTKSAEGAIPVGRVLRNTRAAFGQYDVFLDVWGPFLYNPPDVSAFRKIYSGTAAVATQTAVSSPQTGDIYFQRAL